MRKMQQLQNLIIPVALPIAYIPRLTHLHIQVHPSALGIADRTTAMFVLALFSK